MRPADLRYPGIAALLMLSAVTLLTLIPGHLEAEVASSVTISGYTSVLRSGDSAVAAAFLKSSLDLNSVGNKDVKGYFQLDSLITENYVFLDIPRAYIKVRFPWFRVTLGKTRVSWGDGFVFNAGDVIFGSMGVISGDLSGEALRDETGWLGAVYLPLGAFSFLEAVIFPYDLQAPPILTGLGGAGDYEFPAEDLGLVGLIDFSDLAGGLRGAFKLGSTTLETGYFASGQVAEHKPYISLHGHLLVDWNLSASMAVPMFSPQWQQWEEWLKVSAGLFHFVNLGGSRSLSFRLEAAILPGADWIETSGGTSYGIYLFPEIAFSPTDTLSLQLRTLVSPVDLSALSMASVSWNIYQGLDVFSYLSIMTGDSDDLYSWDGYAGLSWTVGLEFVY